MTHLRQKMLEELRRRNYSHRTATTNVRIVREFAEHFHKSPDKLGPEHIRQFQAHRLTCSRPRSFLRSRSASMCRRCASCLSKPCAATF